MIFLSIYREIFHIVETLGKRNGQVHVREQPRRHFVQLRVIRNSCTSNELRIRTFVIYREIFHKGGGQGGFIDAQFLTPAQ